MTIAAFLAKHRHVNLCFFHHQTETSENAYEFLKTFVQQNPVNYTLIVDTLSRVRYNYESQEEFWRNERYRFFHSFSSPVITGHHLDDCVETWIWSSCHGQGKLIPYTNRNVIRPFRLNRKQKFVRYAVNHCVKWLEDESNSNEDYMRNFIRHTMMPNVLKVNPGIHKVIYKKLKKETDYGLVRMGSK